MSALETLLKDGLRSELIFQHQLKYLRDDLKQQLLETEQRQREELDLRIYQDALISTDQYTCNENQMDHGNRHVAMKNSTFPSALTPHKETLHHFTELDSFKSSIPVSQSPTKQKHLSFRTTIQSQRRYLQCERLSSSKTTQMRKEEEDEAECQKKFRALPVPKHVKQPLYQKMVEREKERKQEHEQRMSASAQKPFGFQEREKEKREKMLASLNQVSHDDKTKAATVRKPPHKEVNHSSASELKAPNKNFIESCGPKLRTAERTRREKLEFLYETPSFKPKIIHKVPDFKKMHRALQTETLRKSHDTEPTKLQPFLLRTSALPLRKRRVSPENTRVQKLSHRRKSRSLGNLTSLSEATLPIFITDAVRKRNMAIRKSMEMRDTKNQESEAWLNTYNMRSQAMMKSITLRAKLLDLNSNLKEVHDDKLQHNRMAEQQRKSEYMRELRDMKARVSERPYLFEQVKQKNAKVRAERAFIDKLKKAGVKERFVKQICEAAEGALAPSRSEDHADENAFNRRASEQLREYTTELRDVKAPVSEQAHLLEHRNLTNAKAHVEQTFRDNLRENGVMEQLVKENGQ